MIDHELELLMEELDLDPNEEEDVELAEDLL